MREKENGENVIILTKSLSLFPLCRLITTRSAELARYSISSWNVVVFLFTTCIRLYTITFFIYLFMFIFLGLDCCLVCLYVTECIFSDWNFYIIFNEFLGFDVDLEKVECRSVWTRRTNFWFSLWSRSKVIHSQLFVFQKI